MANEVKECPFCGGKAKIERIGGKKYLYMTGCVKADCRGFVLESPAYSTSEVAEKRWNERAPDDFVDPRKGQPIIMHE